MYYFLVFCHFPGECVILAIVSIWVYFMTTLDSFINNHTGTYIFKHLSISLFHGSHQWHWLSVWLRVIVCWLNTFAGLTKSHLCWDGNVVILSKLSSLVTVKVVIMISSKLHFYFSVRSAWSWHLWSGNVILRTLLSLAASEVKLSKWPQPMTKIIS